MNAPPVRSASAAEPHHLTVSRTARYYVLGDGDPRSLRQLWIVVHGYGQLAGRFLRHFAPLDDGSRLIVAPEALSRFYLEHPGREAGATGRVGATWMTREDREAEIADQAAYLDALHAAILASLTGPAPTLHVLGFSQGVATVTRWLSHSRVRADHLVLWSGRVPADLFPIPERHPLRRARLDVVMGDADELATAEVLDEQRRLLEGADLGVHWHRFAGGHTMDGTTLDRVAAVAASSGLSDRASGR